MRTVHDFVRLVQNVQKLLRAAARDWSRDSEMPDILRRMAQHFARLICGEPESGSAEEANKTLRTSKAGDEGLGQRQQGQNGTGGRG